MKTRSLKQRRGKKTRRGGGLFSSAKVAPLPSSTTPRTIKSQFDIFIDKFNGSIKDETGKSSPEDITAYYETQPEYSATDTKLRWPYSGTKIKLTYRGSEEYSVNHDGEMCDIKALCDYIASKRIKESKLSLSKNKLSNGAAYIIKTILEKIGTDVTTDSVRRFLLEYVWKDTPTVKRDFQLLNSSNTRRNASKSVKDILTGMLCVRVLIKKKFNEIGYISEDLNDDFSGTNSSLFNNAPAKPVTPIKVTPPPGFIRRCIDGICSIFRKPKTNSTLAPNRTRRNR
jgi:hypothetical protein